MLLLYNVSNYEDTKKKMVEMISHVDDLDMIMYNSYDIFKSKLTDRDLKELADIHFHVTGRLDKANKLYQELDHFNNGLV
jgi:dihydrodipicolinate synthase/N-acetylneuraminate lyase